MARNQWHPSIQEHGYRWIAGFPRGDFAKAPPPGIRILVARPPPPTDDAWGYSPSPDVPRPFTWVVIGIDRLLLSLPTAPLASRTRASRSFRCVVNGLGQGAARGGWSLQPRTNGLQGLPAPGWTAGPRRAGRSAPPVPRRWPGWTSASAVSGRGLPRVSSISDFDTRLCRTAGSRPPRQRTRRPAAPATSTAPVPAASLPSTASTTVQVGPRPAAECGALTSGSISFGRVQVLPTQRDAA
jgi:hypothetical protein